MAYNFQEFLNKKPEQPISNETGELGSVEESPYNRFDTPIPGESLADTPGNSPWERPPRISTVDEAAEYVWRQFFDSNKLKRIHALLDMEVPIEALTRVIVFTGFIEGMWSVDVAHLVAPIVAQQLLVLAKKLKIKKIRIGLKDEKDLEFSSKAVKIKSSMDRAKKVGEKVGEQIQKTDVGGLMSPNKRDKEVI